MPELAGDPVLLEAEDVLDDSVEPEKHLARKREAVTDPADVAQSTAQRFARAYGVALSAKVAAEHHLGDRVELARKMFQHIRAAIDESFHQRGEDAGAAAQRFVAAD